MTEFVQHGDAIDYTPTIDTPAGTVIVQGDLVGVTKHIIKANTLGSVTVNGVFDFPKDTATAMTAGAKVYWDAANSKAVLTATGNKLIGKATNDAAAAATTVRVRLSQ